MKRYFWRGDGRLGRDLRWLFHRLAATVLAGAIVMATAAADDRWDPFKARDEALAAKRLKAVEPERAPPLAPMDGQITSSPQPTGVDGPGPARQSTPLPASPQRERGAQSAPPPAIGTDPGRIDRSDLPPLAGADATTVATDAGATFWAGLDAARVEQLMARIDQPRGSPAAAGLWHRALTETTPPAGTERGRFDVFRLERLVRSGLLDEAAALRPTMAADATPLGLIAQARAAIALGAAAEACGIAGALAKVRGELGGPVGAEAHLITGYCAAIEGNRAAAGFAADLARTDATGSSNRLAALEAYANEVAAVPASGPVTLLEARYLQLTTAFDPAAVARSDAGVRLALARDPAADPGLRLLAAEEAARIAVLSPDELGEIYLALGRLGQASSARQTAPSMKRAELYAAASGERTPLKRARLVRSLLDDARRTGLYGHVLAAAAPLVRDMEIVPEIGWFAETVIEALVAAGKWGDARRIVVLAEKFDRPQGADGLGHWHALIDIADPASPASSPEHLASLQQTVAKGRFTGGHLHRLATVLDALDVNVPVPLWDAANRAPQPKAGSLPETGVLTDLLDASKKKQFGRTLLLSLQALGSDGPEGAHLIALGDTIRALRRAGLEADARRVATEALMSAWPRVTQF